MKIAIYIVMLASAAGAAGLLPSQVRRYGLTNEQIGDILRKHPDAELRITAQDWRRMQYELHRFANMTNYVEEVGDSNGCARLLLRLTDDRETLTASNSVLRTLAVRWRQDADRWYADSTNAWAQWHAVTNRLSLAEAAALARQRIIDAELDGLYADRDELTADIDDYEDKVADVKYLLLRPWFQTKLTAARIKLAAIEVRIQRLEKNNEND